MLPYNIKRWFPLVSQITSAQIRVGYVAWLLAVDAAFLFISALDHIALANGGRSFSAAHSMLWQDLRLEHLWQAAPISLTLLFIAPALVAVPSVFLTSQERLRAPGFQQKWWIPPLHVLLVTVVAYSVLLAPSMTTLSGWQYYEGQFLPSFTPLTSYLNLSILAAGAFALALLAWLAKEAAKRSIFAPRTTGDSSIPYLKLLEMVDIHGQLQPAYRSRTNLNAAAIAREVKAVRTRTSSLLKQYHLHSPASPESVEFLRELEAQARKLLSDLILQECDISDLRIEWFPGTSRAIEVALLRLGRDSCIALSPFEHPCEQSVLEWIGISAGRKIFLPPTAADYSLPFSHSIAKYTDDLAAWAGRIAPSLISPRNTKAKAKSPQATKSHLVLLISDVCYKTGCPIPVREVTSAMRQSLPNAIVTVVIDGAHTLAASDTVWRESLSSGNWDSFVLSAHKWLFSPEPCGILITRRQSRSLLNAPYDAWSCGLPTSTASARMIASVVSALELLKAHGTNAFRLRMRELSKQLVTRLEDNFDIIRPSERDPEPVVICLGPADGKKWRYKTTKELELHFSEHKIDVLVTTQLMRESITPVIRLSVAYYHDYYEMSRTAHAIEGILLVRP